MKKVNKIKMKSTGVKSEFGDKEIVYPTLTLNKNSVPKIKNLKIDDTIEIVAKIKVTEIGRAKWGKEKGELRATADILSIGVKDMSYEDEYADRMGGDRD